MPPAAGTAMGRSRLSNTSFARERRSASRAARSRRSDCRERSREASTRRRVRSSGETLISGRCLKPRAQRPHFGAMQTAFAAIAEMRSTASLSLSPRFPRRNPTGCFEPICN